MGNCIGTTSTETPQVKIHDETRTEVDFFKVLVIGNPAVGKSALVLRFTDSAEFQEGLPATVGVDFKHRRIDLDGESVKLQIWDTAGQEKYRAIVSALFRGAHGVAVVFDLTNRESFESIPMWFTEVDKFLPKSRPRILLGNKCDMKLDRTVSTKEAQELAQSLGVEYVETSAKDLINVDESFEKLARMVKSRLVNGTISNN